MNISGYTEAFSFVQQDSQTSKWCSYFKHILTGKKRENQMKKKFFRLSAAVLLFFSGIMEIGWRFFNMVVCCKRGGRKKERKKWFELSHIRDNHPRNGYAKEYDESRAWCEAQKMQDCYIQSVDGLKLHGFYLPAEHAKRFVILSHGYRGSRFGSLSFMAKYLHEHQCNLLFMEQRCCGESEGKYITFGAKEKWDVQRWAIYVSERNKEKLPIYLYGQSMGAAAVLMSSGYRLPSEVKGLIADCGFQSMERQMRDMADNWFHLHYIPLLLKEMDCLCHFVAGFRMKDADTTEAMKSNTRPVLFFHGEKDTYVYPNNSFQNYMLCKAPKELVIVQGARHLCSAYADPELYQRTVMEFFEKYDGSNSEK